MRDSDIGAQDTSKQIISVICKESTDILLLVVVCKIGGGARVGEWCNYALVLSGFDGNPGSADV